MRRPLKASVCRKVEKAVLARPAAYKDLEVSNILYGFVKTRFNSPELLGVMEDRSPSSSLSGFPPPHCFPDQVFLEKNRRL